MKLQKSSIKGRSDQFYAYLPKSIVEAMKWKKGDILTVEILGRDMLKLARKKYSPGKVEEKA